MSTVILELVRNGGHLTIGACSVAGPRGPAGDTPVAVTAEINSAIAAHETDPEPHSAYDDGADLVLIFENGLI